MGKKYLKLAVTGMLVSLFVFPSCVDNDYDLNKDIDMTISIGGEEFALPGGSTEEMTLEKILDLNEDDMVKADRNGDYSLVKDGDKTDPTKVSVEEVRVDAPEVEPIRDIDLSFTPETRSALLASSEKLIALIPEDKKTAFNFHKEEMPEEIKTLDNVSTQMLTRIHFSIESLEQIAAKAYFDELRIIFPAYFDLKESSDNIIRVYNKYVDAKGLDIFVNVQAIDFTASGLLPGERVEFDGNTHVLDLKGNIRVEGSMYINSADLVTASGTEVQLVMTADVTMGDMDIIDVNGILDPKIDVDDQLVEFSGLPDFLTDDEVVMDVENPMVNLSVYNETPLPVDIDASLVSVKNNVVIKKVQVPTFTAMAGNGENNGTTTYICLAQMDEGVPEGYKLVLVNEADNNLTSLVKQIPDEIKLEIKAKAQQIEVEMSLGKDYLVNTDYDINVPLAFGPDFRIVYRDTINDWHKDIEDYEVQRINLTAEAYNSIPLDLILTAEAIDVDGNVIDGIEVTVDQDILAGIQNVPTVTPVLISLIEKTSGSMKILDGIRLRAEGNITKENSEKIVGTNLNQNQYLQLKKMKLKVPGGLKINLN